MQHEMDSVAVQGLFYKEMSPASWWLKQRKL